MYSFIKWYVLGNLNNFLIRTKIFFLLVVRAEFMQRSKSWGKEESEKKSHSHSRERETCIAVEKWIAFITQRWNMKTRLSYILRFLTYTHENTLLYIKCHLNYQMNEDLCSRNLFITSRKSVCSFFSSIFAWEMYHPWNKKCLRFE